MKTIHMLDCTLRDGGYYCSWDFSKDLVFDYLEAIDVLGVDLVELGFRSAENSGFKGGFAYTTDDFLNSLNIPDNLKDKIGVMVNGSELTDLDSQNKVLESLFVKKQNSLVSFVRIACHIHEFEDCLPASKWLKEKGYHVGFNLMQIADQTLSTITSIGKKANEYPIDVLYFADSMGSLYAGQVKKIVHALRQGWKGELGIHTHDNMGQAIQNSLTAIEKGVTWVDSTVTGMGRGAGNAQTEFLAISLDQHKKSLGSPTKLFKVIRKHFKPMQQHYGWGVSPYYYLAGKYGIHPSYVQEMLSDSRYNEESILSALNYLKAEGGKKFNISILAEAFPFYSGDLTGAWNPKNVIEGRTVLVVGTGPSVRQHRFAIEQYIKRYHPYVIALNTQSHLDNACIDVRAACHPIRILADCKEHMQLPQPLITPYSMLSDGVQSELKEKTIFDYGIKIKKDQFAFNDNHCVIPSSLVVSYVLAIANSGHAKKINLVGFDGYNANDGRAQEMKNVLQLYSQIPNSLALYSLTETNYEIEMKSIYGSMD